MTYQEIQCNQYLKGETMKYCIYVEDEDERGVGLVYSEIKNIKDAELLAFRLMTEMAKGESEFAGNKTVLIVPYFTADSIPARRNGKEIAEELHKKHRVDNIGSYHVYKYGRKKADEIREIRDCYQQIKNILEDND